MMPALLLFESHPVSSYVAASACMRTLSRMKKSDTTVYHAYTWMVCVSSRGQSELCCVFTDDQPVHNQHRNAPLLVY